MSSQSSSPQLADPSFVTDEPIQAQSQASQDVGPQQSDKPTEGNNNVAYTDTTVTSAGGSGNKEAELQESISNINEDRPGSSDNGSTGEQVMQGSRPGSTPQEQGEGMGHNMQYTEDYSAVSQIFADRKFQPVVDLQPTGADDMSPFGDGKDRDLMDVAAEAHAQMQTGSADPGKSFILGKLGISREEGDSMDREIRQATESIQNEAPDVGNGVQQQQPILQEGLKSLGYRSSPEVGCKAESAGYMINLNPPATNYSQAVSYPASLTTVTSLPAFTGAENSAGVIIPAPAAPNNSQQSADLFNSDLQYVVSSSADQNFDPLPLPMDLYANQGSTAAYSQPPAYATDLSAPAQSTPAPRQKTGGRGRGKKKNQASSRGGANTATNGALNLSVAARSGDFADIVEQQQNVQAHAQDKLAALVQQLRESQAAQLKQYEEATKRVGAGAYPADLAAAAEAAMQQLPVAVKTDQPLKNSPADQIPAPIATVTSSTYHQLLTPIEHQQVDLPNLQQIQEYAKLAQEAGSLSAPVTPGAEDRGEDGSVGPKSEKSKYSHHVKSIQNLVTPVSKCIIYTGCIATYATLKLN